MSDIVDTIFEWFEGIVARSEETLSRLEETLARLAAIEDRLCEAEKREEAMAIDLQAIKDSAQRSADAMDSAVQLINGLVNKNNELNAQLSAEKESVQQLEAVVGQLLPRADALAQAVATGTPAEH
jgi:chromosome segregation ATPase